MLHIKDSNGDSLKSLKIEAMEPIDPPVATYLKKGIEGDIQVSFEQGSFFVRTSSIMPDMQMKVLDLHGALVAESKVLNSVFTRVPVKAASSGCYMVLLTQGSRILYKKIIYVE
mgnify:CR=1 FL=1